jgi:hypothetical protein
MLIFIGNYSLNNTLQTTWNITIRYNANDSYLESKDNNILIGNALSNVAGKNNIIYIGGSQNKFYTKKAQQTKFKVINKIKVFF